MEVLEIIAHNLMSRDLYLPQKIQVEFLTTCERSKHPYEIRVD